MTSITDIHSRQFEHLPKATAEAPGRVNLIGEHIDYNGGHVMPLALDCAIRVAASPRTDGVYRLWSEQFQELYEGPLPDSRLKEPFWANYLFGVVHEFRRLGHEVSGLDAAVDGDVPRGSGLSSSAAYEVAVAWALQVLLGTGLSRMEIALLGQRAENGFVGVNCGIMDQAISAGGRAGHAMLLDCNRLEAEHIPLRLDRRAALLVAHCGVHRGLTASAYNERRGKCDEALEILRRETRRPIPCLCEATLEDLETHAEAMDQEALRRARHAITEEQRVRKAAIALRQDDLATVGWLLDASHESLRDDYEVSCDELDALTDFIRAQDGAWGSRLTGAGFGGCTVSLLQADAADDILERLRTDWYKPRRIEPVAFFTDAREGVRSSAD